MVPGTIKGPRKLDVWEEGASDEGIADDVAERITSGSKPVDAACWPEEPEVVGAADESAVGAGWTMDSVAGRPPVEPGRILAKRDDRKPPEG